MLTEGKGRPQVTAEQVPAQNRGWYCLGTFDVIVTNVTFPADGDVIRRYARIFDALRVIDFSRRTF